RGHHRARRRARRAQGQARGWRSKSPQGILSGMIREAEPAPRGPKRAKHDWGKGGPRREPGGAAGASPATLRELAVLLGAVALVLLAAFPYFEQVRNANELPRLVQA